MWDLIYKPLVYTAGYRPFSPPGNLMGENLQAHLDRPRVSNEMTRAEGGGERGGGRWLLTVLLPSISLRSLVSAKGQGPFTQSHTWASSLQCLLELSLPPLSLPPQPDP